MRPNTLTDLYMKTSLHMQSYDNVNIIYTADHLHDILSRLFLVVGYMQNYRIIGLASIKQAEMQC